MSTRSSPAERFDDVAEVVERLAVLLEAGLAPVSAWRHVADEAAGVAATPFSSVVEAMAAGPVSSVEIPDRIRAAVRALAEEAPSGARGTDGAHDAILVVAAVWRVASISGAPLAPTLAAFAGTVRELAEAERALEVALAGPRATSRIVLALPPLGLLVGSLIGVDALGVLVGTPVGIACLVAGAALVTVAVRWNRRMLAAARRRERAPGIAAELTAVALAGGATPERALATVGSALDECALRKPDGPDPLDPVARQLAFAARAGAPAGVLLRSGARASRRRARSDAQRRGTELATRLVLPLGVCVLPAFVLLGVVPIAVSLLSSTAAGW